MNRLFLILMTLNLSSAHAALQTGVDDERPAKYTQAVVPGGDLTVQDFEGTPTIDAVHMQTNGEMAAKQLISQLADRGLLKGISGKPGFLRVSSKFDVRDHRLLKVLVSIVGGQVSVLERFDENGSLYAFELPDTTGLKRQAVPWNGLPDARKDSLKRSGEEVAVVFVKTLAEQKGGGAYSLPTLKIPMSRYNPNSPGVLDVLIVGQRAYGGGREVDFVNVINVVFSDAGEVRSLSLVAL